jgi:hypothetical protein
MGTGSVAIAAWIARIVFGLLVVEALVEERFRVALIATVFTAVGWALLSRINADLVTPFVAIVDIALVLVVHQRDIRLN